MTTRSLPIVIALFFIIASSTALADPCQNNTESVKHAVEEIANTLDEHGIEYVKHNLLKSDGTTICGIIYINIIDSSGTWVVFPASSEYVGKNILSLGDGAATNFFKGIINGAIESKGKLVSYFTKDTDQGVVINKSLYFIYVPSRKLVVYGAFASK